MTVRTLGLALALALLVAGVAAPAASASARVDAAVRHALARTPSGDDVDVIVVLRRQAALPSAPASNRAGLLAGLRTLADREQRRLVALLAIRRLQGRVSRVRPFWIFNGVEVVAEPDVITELAALPEVAEIRPNATVQAPSGPTAGAGAEWNVARVNAPALWAGSHRGQGIVVANMDTGVDATHPDLSTKWRGGANSWFDPNGEHPSTPTDVSGHGTWTMGVMVGGEAGGTAVGVAPDARWIAVKIFNDHGTATAAGIHAGFQWLLDPDGNPATADAPDVVNGSWTMSGGGCDLAFQLDLRNLRAAGILPVFSAGNSGPFSPSSLSPANYPEAFAVGGTDANDALYPGSSRGPSACDQAIYPRLSAPGVDVRTTDLYGFYTTATGTSIAAPHVAGTLALLLEEFPGTDADRQAAALQSGAVDLGTAGPDNDFGAGRLDAFAAREWLATGPDFSVAATPASASAPASYTLAIDASNGFDGDVALSLTGLTTSQASWSFAPASVSGAGSSQLTVTAAASLPPGSYPLTIRGTSGSVTHSAGVSLVVPAPPDFSLTATPTSQSTSAGGSVSYTVSAAAQGGFSGDIALALTGAASGSFSPATITGGAGASQLTVTTAPSLAPGTYALTITGTSASLEHSATVSLLVPDFSLTATPASRSTAAGGSVSYTVTSARTGGFAGSVALSLSGLVAGQATWGFFPAAIPGGAGSSQLTVATAAALAPGSYPLTIRGTSGALSHTAATTLNVTGFQVSIAPSSATVVAGQSTSYTVSVSSLGGFAGSVSLSVAGLGSGATGAFAPLSVAAPGTSALTVRTTRLAARGTFTLTVTGRSGALVRQATATLTVRS